MVRIQNEAASFVSRNATDAPALWIKQLLYAVLISGFRGESELGHVRSDLESVLVVIESSGMFQVPSQQITSSFRHVGGCTIWIPRPPRPGLGCASV